jgi:hypothetical protein
MLSADQGDLAIGTRSSIPDMVRSFLLGAKIHIAKQIAWSRNFQQDVVAVRGRSVEIDQPSLNAIKHVHWHAGAKDGLAFRVDEISVPAGYQPSDFGREVEIYQTAFENPKAVNNHVKPFSDRFVYKGAYAAICNR